MVPRKKKYCSLNSDKWMKPTLEEDTYKTQRREDKDTKPHNLKKNIGYLNKEET